MSIDRIRIRWLTDRGGAAWRKYEALREAAVHSTHDSPQNVALREYQHELMTDFAGTVAAVEAAAETTGGQAA
jgi:hypothetical protein